MSSKILIPRSEAGLITIRITNSYKYCWTVYGAGSWASTHIAEGTQWVAEVI